MLKPWDKALICTLHKVGPLNETKNYRGMSLLNITSKLFTKILNERFTMWAENQIVYQQEQADFRKGYSTIEQMFILFIMSCKLYLKRRVISMLVSWRF